ncbi:MAG: molybdopterin molybdotransferase MoeA [Rhodobiaceae bacterium]|nr:molybdopterin molybdotransferase MoeA [Rhodobiaceae bacterium]
MNKEIANISSNCNTHNKKINKHEELLAFIEQKKPYKIGSKNVEINKSLSFFTSTELTSISNIPANNNSAVDGYAIKYSDLKENKKNILNTYRIITAGDNKAYLLDEMEAIEIFTGSIIPKNADTIVMKEDATILNNNQIKLDKPINMKQNIRKAGEDIKKNQLVFNKNHQLNEIDIGTLASLGFQNINVFNQLKIGIISTGNEIKRPGEMLKLSESYDSNFYTINNALKKLPVIISDYGVVKDNPHYLLDILKKSSQECDLIITTGGASQGGEDHIIKTINEYGNLDIWQLAIKPGRPMGLGTFNKKNILMLPGNPVAAIICLYLYGFPLIRRLGNGLIRVPQRYLLPAGFNLENKKLGRREFLRGKISYKDNSINIEKYENSGSAILSSLRLTDGLIEINEETKNIYKGDLVKFIPFNEFY